METAETTFTDGQLGTYPEFDCSKNAHENATQSGSQKGLEHSTHEDLIAQTKVDPLYGDGLRPDLTTVESQLNLELKEIPISNISGERSIPTLASTKEKTTTDQSEEKTNTSVFDQSDERTHVNIDLVENTNKPINNLSEEQPNLSLKISESSLETQKLQDMDGQKSNAVIIYRWSKTLVTKSEDIGFYPSYEPDNPILLSWNENVQAYFSSELRVVCGDYHGNLIVDGKIYPVEEFSIRTYTFEVDLFMKDAPEEKPTSHSELKEPSYEQHLSSGQTFMDPDSVDTSRTYTISSADVGKQDYQVTQEVGELLKHKMVEDDVLKDNAQEKFMSSSLKSNGEIPLAGMKRDSPVGNADAGKFLESSFQRQEILEPSDDHFTIQDLRTSVEGPVSSSPRDPGKSGLHSVLAEESARLNMRSQLRGSGGSAVGSETGGGLRGSRPPSVGADSDHSSLHGSLKHSLSNDALYSRHEAKVSDRLSPDSLRSGDSPSLGTEKHKSISDQVSVRSSTKNSSTLLNEAISSKEGATHLSGVVHSFSRVIPNRDLADDGMFKSKRRFTENRDNISPPSSVSGRPPTHPSIRSGSLHSSRSESLISITSEHELTGYFEQSRSQHTGYLPLSSSVNYDKSSRASSNTKVTDRSPSFPNWTSQISSDRRSVTPDIRSQVPVPSGETEERVRDVHNSSSPASRISSCVSSRTVTPVQANTDERIKELEASVTNLRKLLASRESEVHSLTSQLEDMRDINRSLRDELDHRGRRHTPVNSLQESFEYKQLQSEKEILVSEVVALRDELQRFNKGQSFGSGRNKAGPGISDYSPNSPTVLVRKIGDLEAHIRDLQEVSETTNSSLVEAERKLKLLQNENRELKSGSITAAASQAQSDHDLRVELRTLREDIRNLKERNYQLTEENMQLLDGQKGDSKETMIHSLGGGSRLGALRSGDRQSSGYSINAALAHEFSQPSYGGIAGNRPSSASLIASKKVSHDDLAPKDLRQSSVNQAPVYEPDPLTNESWHHQHRTISDSSRLWLQPRETTARSKSTESSSKSLQYLDRSKPDGEVSEKSYHDSFIRPLPRETHEDRRRERESYGDKHSSFRPHLPRESTEILKKDKFDVGDKDDKYRYLNGGLHEREPRTGTMGRHPSSGLQLNSRDIYFSLQQKRASRWPQREKESQKLSNQEKENQKASNQEKEIQKLSNQTEDYDSDSTQALLGYKSELPANKTSGSQTIKKTGDEKQGTLASDGHQLHHLFPHDNKYISGNLDLHRYQPNRVGADNAADDSDTATDILLAQDSTPRGPPRHRRTSLGSDGSPASFSDGEDTADSLLRRRSKSVDVKRGQSRQVSSLSRSESASRSLATTENIHGSAGFRSVIPAPLVTQHNKGEVTSRSMTSLLSSSLTQGLRPFAPRSPADIRVEDVVKFSRPGGKLTQGVVKYIGHLPGRNEAYLGVELDKDEGKHDGTFEGVRFFKCKPNKGVFVAFNKIVMAWAP